MTCREVIAQETGSDDKIAIKDKLCATGVMLKCIQQTIKQYKKFVLDGNKLICLNK